MYGSPSDVTNHVSAFLHRHGWITCVYTWDSPVQDPGPDVAISKVSHLPQIHTN